MELVLKKDSEKIWVFWARYKAKKAKDFINIARIKKDGYFYKNDRARLFVRANLAFHSLLNYFIFTDEMFDERNTLVRALETLNAEQFKAFASLIIEPYKDINPIEAT